MYSISFWFCQDDSIKRIVDKYGTNDWKLIANHFSDRSDIQCQHRWYKVLNPELIKGPWTKEVCFSYYICVLIMPILFGRILHWLRSTRQLHKSLKFVRCHHSYGECHFAMLYGTILEAAFRHCVRHVLFKKNSPSLPCCMMIFANI